MMPPIEEVVTFVRHLAPTWRKELHQTCAEVLAAFWDRSCLCLSDLARALSAPEQSLHGRLKRLGRWLDNRHLDELALSVRWVRLTYEWVVRLPEQPSGRPLLPILLDTVYFQPFAVLLATVPCGSRGLPIALTTYHRKTLEACFPPEATWPDPTAPTSPTLRERLGLPARPPLAAATKKAFLSQNHIEEHLLALVLRLVCPALRRVIVADRGFARASLFRWLLEHAADFVIRFDAETHVYLDPDGESQAAATALQVQRGEQRWVEQAWYQKEERVPMRMLAVWDQDAEEPWYLGTSLGRADWTAQCYRWRMRCECTHRDEKTGILLRCGGGDHQLTNVLHMHRLALALCLAEWCCALVGLQAWRELPALPGASPTLLTSEHEANTAPSPTPDQPPLEAAPPLIEPDASYLAQGPAEPPPPLPSVVTAPSRPSLQTTRRRRAKRGRQTLRGARLAELS
ncbi:MAG TPA: transposase, partial [Chloroflexota bacterium]